MNVYVIAGIGTGVGKTIISAILTEALGSDYWKPVQAGNLDKTDTDIVRHLVSNNNSIFHPETYRLSQPMSPHAASEIDGIEIKTGNLLFPATKNKLIVELAGGLMVPLNKTQTNMDLLKQWNVPVILVSRNYLGSINHTLLSIYALRNFDIPVKGIIFNGASVPSTEETILQKTGIDCLARINNIEHADRSSIKSIAAGLNLQSYQ